MRKGKGWEDHTGCFHAYYLIDRDGTEVSVVEALESRREESEDEVGLIWR